MPSMSYNARDQRRGFLATLFLALLSSTALAASSPALPTTAPWQPVGASGYRPPAIPGADFELLAKMADALPAPPSMPGLTDYTLERARIYAVLGNMPKVIEIMKDPHKLNELYGIAYEMRLRSGRAAEAAKIATEARAWADRVRSQYHIEANSQLAMGSLYAGDMAGAANWVNSIAVPPARGAALATIGGELLRRGDRQNAWAAASVAPAAPNLSRVLLRLGNSFEASGDTRSAIAAYARACLEPQSDTPTETIPLLAVLGQARCGDREGAIRNAAGSPASTVLLVRLAQMLAAQNRSAEAMQALEAMTFSRDDRVRSPYSSRIEGMIWLARQGALRGDAASAKLTLARARQLAATLSSDDSKAMAEQALNEAAAEVPNPASMTNLNQEQTLSRWARGMADAHDPAGALAVAARISDAQARSGMLAALRAHFLDAGDPAGACQVAESSDLSRGFYDPAAQIAVAAANANLPAIATKAMARVRPESQATECRKVAEAFIEIGNPQAAAAAIELAARAAVRKEAGPEDPAIERYRIMAVQLRLGQSAALRPAIVAELALQTKALERGESGAATRIDYLLRLQTMAGDGKAAADLAGHLQPAAYSSHVTWTVLSQLVARVLGRELPGVLY